ncbi:MAG: PorT family protein [Prevotellaceae bacterium]|jgi:hypothetical protein|nr:PorT family protein [Prevotellaceae bacterium]
MKKTIIITSLLILCTSLSAQRLGFIGGYQLTNSYAVVGGKTVDFNPKAGSGFHVGAYFDWTFKKNYGIDAQLVYALRNTKFDLHYNSDTTIIFKRQIFNLELPVHIYANYRLGKDFVLSPFLGPSFNMGLHGKDIAWENTDYQKPVDMENKSLFDKDSRINRFEVAGDIGVSLKYRNYAIRTLYSVGFTNLTRKNFDWTLSLASNRNKYLFNRVFKISFVYVFDLKSKY